MSSTANSRFVAERQQQQRQSPHPSAAVGTAATLSTQRHDEIGGESSTATPTATAIVPEHDICRLTFYLKCCILGCGLLDSCPALAMLIHDRYIDYTKAHRALSLQEQLYVLNLVVGEFNLQRLINRVLFVDDSGELLPPNVSNSFYHVETVSTYLNIQPQLPLFSTAITLRQVMVCTSQWIHEFYALPIAGLQHSLCNMPNCCQIFASPLQFLQPPSSTQTLHCIHCLGISGQYCTCEEGCSPLPGVGLTGCSIVHRGIGCDECASNGGPNKSTIVGKRYKCLACKPHSNNNDDDECNHVNLCENCYSSGEHDQTHAFDMYCRPCRSTDARSTHGSSGRGNNTNNPSTITTREQQPKRLRPKCIIFLGDTSKDETLKAMMDDIPEATAIPIETAYCATEEED